MVARLAATIVLAIKLGVIARRRARLLPLAAQLLGRIPLHHAFPSTCVNHDRLTEPLMPVDGQEQPPSPAGAGAHGRHPSLGEGARQPTHLVAVLLKRRGGTGRYQLCPRQVAGLSDGLESAVGGDLGGHLGGQVLGELAALAAAGGSALVGAMATDAWQATRSWVAGLFGRSGPAAQAAIEAQLDGHAALVSQAEDPDEVQESLVAVWQLQLQSLLRQHPEVEEDLRELVARVREALPVAQQTWVQTNIAHDQASQNIVQHGTLHVHPGGAE